ncbi:uncharacterized protein LOC108856770 isoform X2 [Raphanus sativus]|uniref:Uncharacterized protein LOC108856770 isoform X2 n=1 Tax=Raphanus sativus TaxID=3726 RepID=A0A9W3DDT6_RAPSA|nr:uncharacterized protein LOC108856770 isoform X2 [Raphanus sativus]
MISMFLMKKNPLPTPLPDSSSLYNIPTGSSDYNTPETENGSNADVKARPSPYIVSPTFDNRQGLMSMLLMRLREETLINSLRRTYLCHPLGNGSVSDDSSEQYQNGGYIPQHDGASDAMPQANLEGNAFCMTFVGDRKFPRDVICSSSKIPQVDGPMPDAYDEMLSTPNCEHV